MDQQIWSPGIFAQYFAEAVTLMTLILWCVTCWPVVLRSEAIFSIMNMNIGNF